MGAVVDGAERQRLCPVFVGREDVLALARRRWRDAAAGTGHLLFLTGEAGIGKTRAIREIVGEVRADGGTVVGANAHPRDAQTVGGVLVDFAAVLRRTGAPRLAAAGARLAAALTPAGPPRHVATELAEELIGLAASPLLLVLEDLHWADSLTLDVLDRVAAAAPRTALLLIGSYRSDELVPGAPARAWRTRLLNQRLAEESRLPRLSPAESAAMCAAIAGTAVAGDLTAAVHARGDGVPLHIEELFAAPGALPETLADAVRARAARLSGPARTIAGCAAVLGRTFDVEALARVAGDPAAVDAALRELGDQYFVLAAEEGYEFRHALIREAIYADLPPLARRDLHARAAETAVRAGFGDAYVSGHYEQAHQPEPAYRHALAAAREATAMSAHREAVELYRRAQRTAPASIAPALRAGLVADLAASLAAIDENDAAAAAYEEAMRRYKELGMTVAAAALAPALSATRHLLGASLAQRAALLEAALADVEDQDQRVSARILAALAAAFMLDRRLEVALEYGERACAVAAVAAEPEVVRNASVTLGVVHVFAGRMDEGWDLLCAAAKPETGAGPESEAEIARAFRMIGSCASVLVEYDLSERWLRDGIAYAERTERWNDRHYMAAHLSHLHWCTGDWHAAEAVAAQALADGRHGITTRITALHVQGYLAMGRGDHAAAVRILTDACDLGEGMSELQRLAPAWWGLAETALLADEPDQAIEWCEQGFAASAAVDDTAYLHPFLLTGVRAHLHTNRLTAARAWFDRVESALSLRAIPGTVPAVIHAAGLLHYAAGHTGQARTRLEAARDAWDGRRRFWEGTWARLDLATCDLRARRTSAAATHATQVRDRATVAGAQALIDRILPLPPAAPQSLTPREAEVASLVATGATNKQIASQLWIAPKTVATHIEHILSKLGMSRRAEIAAWVSRNT